MASALKTIVSKNKNRHREGKFDLDLTYISPRIIAMGYPAENFESIYRNDYNMVKEFLDKKHGTNYWVYNLCSEKERIYDKKKFDGRVTCYPFDDHHPPVFNLIQPFCDEVKSYLAQDERNVAVVHCKAGKGRTGVMICCYLLHIRAESAGTAEDVLKLYGDKRTADQKGVTIPSQRRYITYYDTMLGRELAYKPVKLYLKDIVLDPMPNFGGAGGSQFYVYFEVKQRGRKIPYRSKSVVSRKGDRTVTLSVNPPLLLSEDVKFEFSTQPKFEHMFLGNNTKTPQKFFKSHFHFWLNTFFVDMPIKGGLAHDLTASNPIAAEASGPPGHHLHHASGSSEDSSAEDIPIKNNQQGNGLTVTFVDQSLGDGNSSEMTNLIKLTSISDDHLLQEQRARQTDQDLSQKGPLSNSNENCTTDSTSSTTAESFKIQRSRHSSVPQPPRLPNNHSANHHHHPHLESSLSQVVDMHHHHRAFLSRTHATITANSTETSASASPVPPIDIPGKLLSLRLKKGQIDKAVKDKACKTYPDNFSVTLFLVKPEDQSEKLIDYTLLPKDFLALTNNSSTITTASSSMPLVENMTKQFTVVPVDKPRSRPLTGGSGASSSSATPSLKSMEQSSQDSAASSDEGGAEAGLLCDKYHHHHPKATKRPPVSSPPPVVTASAAAAAQTTWI